jgi:hypothetical protein
VVFSQTLVLITLHPTSFPFRLRSSLRQFDLAVRLTQWKRRRTLSALVCSRPLSVAERSSRLGCVLGCCSALVRCSTAYHRNLDGVKYGWLKVFQSSATEVGECKCHFGCIVGVRRVLTEVEVAQEDEVVEIPGIRTIKRIRFFGLGPFGG